MLGEIFKIEAFITGMIAEDGGWNRTALNFHMGNNRKFHCNGTASKSGHIIDDCNFFLFVMVGHETLPFYFVFLILFIEIIVISI